MKPTFSNRKELSSQFNKDMNDALNKKLGELREQLLARGYKEDKIAEMLQ